MDKGKERKRWDLDVRGLKLKAACFSFLFTNHLLRVHAILLSILDEFPRFVLVFSRLRAISMCNLEVKGVIVAMLVSGRFSPAVQICVQSCDDSWMFGVVSQVW